jgi:hypothetical protein
VSKTYHKIYAEKLKLLVIACGLVNRRGQPAWKKIAEVLNKSEKTLQRWRDPRSNYYQKEFAEAAKEAEEAAETGQIKRSMIDKAKGYILRKVVRETNKLTGKLGIVREEKTNIAGDVQAAKLVLANFGPPEKRWYDKPKSGFPACEELEIEINVNEVTPGSKPETKTEDSV